MSEKNDIWAFNSKPGLNIETTLRSRFVADTSGEVITFIRKYNIRKHPLAVIDTILPLVAQASISGIIAGDVAIQGKVKGHPTLILASNGAQDYDEPGLDDEDALPASADIADSRAIIAYSIEITGHREAITFLFNHLDKVFEQIELPQIKWWYEQDGPGRISFQQIFLDPLKTKLLPEFYPGFGDPHTLLKRYLDAEASVLLLAGPPGTGKTTMLRHLIAENTLTAHIVYEERIMEKDTVFQNFLFDKNSDLLIIEDADSILRPRDRDKNKLMARFLNVSDGLIKMPNKKVVFTTNLSSFDNVDEALTRPGRCFGVFRTRELTYEEAVIAAKAAGLPTPPRKEKPPHEYTLAELFNQATPAPKVETVGFSR